MTFVHEPWARISPGSPQTGLIVEYQRGREQSLLRKFSRKAHEGLEAVLADFKAELYALELKATERVQGECEALWAKTEQALDAKTKEAVALQARVSKLEANMQEAGAALNAKTEEKA